MIRSRSAPSMIAASTAFAFAVALAGCNPSNSGSTSHETPHENHQHPTEGPHQGTLVELGNEEYHAELVHGQGGLVTVYLLDGEARQPVPVEAAEITINLTHAGEVEQFKLAASPDAGDTDGRASRFQLDDAHLAEDLDAEGSQARLSVTIGGKQYSGTISHDHDHAGHDHAGHDSH